jgi:hypothetical protein
MDDKLMKKVSKLGLADWCAEIENVVESELKQKIFLAEGNIHNIHNAMEVNEEIIRLKAELKEITDPIKESLDIENTKIKYIIQLLESRGVEIGV